MRPDNEVLLDDLAYIVARIIFGEADATLGVNQRLVKYALCQFGAASLIDKYRSKP